MINQHFFGARAQDTNRPQVTALLPVSTASLTLPASTNNAALVTWRYDQAGENSCEAHVAASCIRYEELFQSFTPAPFLLPGPGAGGSAGAPSPIIIPSRQFLYYNARLSEGHVDDNGGVYMFTVLNNLATQGFLDESFWPYLALNEFTNPGASNYAIATHDLIGNYYGIAQDHSQFVACLASGHPFMFTFPVYASFESPTSNATGIIPMPNPNIEQLLGFHALLCLDYDDGMQRYTCLNSWGAGWGDGGLCHLPYAYVDTLAWDYATIRSFVAMPITSPGLVAPTGPGPHLH